MSSPDEYADIAALFEKAKRGLRAIIDGLSEAEPRSHAQSVSCLARKAKRGQDRGGNSSGSEDSQRAHKQKRAERSTRFTLPVIPSKTPEATPAWYKPTSVLTASSAGTAQTPAQTKGKHLCFLLLLMHRDSLSLNPLRLQKAEIFALYLGKHLRGARAARSGHTCWLVPALVLPRVSCLE